MLSPIPLSVLIDSAVHAPMAQASRGKSYGPDATIDNVCIQNSNVKKEENGSYITVAGSVMFWDVNNSTQAIFKDGDRITYTTKQGITYTRYIVSIVEAQTNEGLHHLELMLV